MNEQGRGVAACGNDCAACPRNTATVSGGALRLREVAELWYRLGWRDRVVSADDIKWKRSPETAVPRSSGARGSC